MKRIKFEKIKLNKYSIALLVLAAIFIIAGSGLLHSFNSIFLICIGIIIILFYLSKFFWYKNYVTYNDNNIYIRINSHLGKRFNFEPISKVNLTSELLVIKENDACHEIDLHRIDRNDIDDLVKIVVTKSKAEFSSNIMDKQFYSNL